MSVEQLLSNNLYINFKGEFLHLIGDMGGKLANGEFIFNNGAILDKLSSEEPNIRSIIKKPIFRLVNIRKVSLKEITEHTLEEIIRHCMNNKIRTIVLNNLIFDNAHISFTTNERTSSHNVIFNDCIFTGNCILTSLGDQRRVLFNGCEITYLKFSTADSVNVKDSIIRFYSPSPSTETKCNLEPTTKMFLVKKTGDFKDIIKSRPQILFSKKNIKDIIERSKILRKTWLKNSIINHNEVDENSNMPYIFNHKTWSQLISTYKQMLTMPEFEYARDDIEQYIHYFRSRTNMLHRLLFWFNGAFRLWRLPLIAIIGSALFIHFTIESLPNNSLLVLKGQRPTGITYAWNPIKIMSEVIFYGFGNFESAVIIFLKKAAIFILEIVFVFSLFSFVVALKRKFGFKRID